MTLPLRSAIEADEGRAFIHESATHLWPFCKASCATVFILISLAASSAPSDPARYAHKDYLYVAASSAAELILIGNRYDERLPVRPQRFCQSRCTDSSGIHRRSANNFAQKHKETQKVSFAN
jgi:hypothetical protein